ncbi:MAG: hypothetical protein E6J89_01640 [Deltaproteobacteria bacterium]|nr:MAG: hypothetical protein E6J89_01640 [Deltaproteobacteria bacterium]
MHSAPKTSSGLKRLRCKRNKPTPFPSRPSPEPHHYAFHVSDEESDAIFKHVQEAGIPWGGDPWSMENRQLNSHQGGRGVYFCDPNGHVLELLRRA